ncbi:MAG: UDP-N-acetylmuramate--L-alanine ligase [Candidatus Gracilibacteria bacterium]|nr:UDP-N-acetylmuramate--L-alanine ligase [Candidatus Gracilibacteria bacterium]
MKKIYLIGIGGIGISAIARYYKKMGWKVLGSDKYGSELTDKLKSEGIDIIIGEDEKRITNYINLVVYTEAIPREQSELSKSLNIGIKTINYSESLGEIANEKKLIAIAGSHGKSTTSSLTAIMLKNSKLGVNAVIGTLLKEFNNKNCSYSDSDYFVIEACEYKRSFLKYTPYIGVITNIDLDHLDYYKDLEDYESAFKSFLDNIKSGGYAILNGNCDSSKKLLGLRNDINYIIINENNFYLIDINKTTTNYNYPNIKLQVPGEHILFDAKIAYTIGKILNLNNDEILKSLENYTGVRRRSEVIGKTLNGNILMSDYGHHPTEIKYTLDALKEKNKDTKLFVVFQPHQYSRTLNLIEGFKNCFSSADYLIIPNIYESRDTKEDKEKINSKKLIELINHSNKKDGENMENTLNLINDYDLKNPNSSIILLLGAGNVDDLRYKIKLK